jgi:hypothetical protein
MSKRGIPLDNEALKRHETNGLKTDEYCKFCYVVHLLTKYDVWRYERNSRNTNEEIETFRTFDPRCGKHSAYFKPLENNLICFISINDWQMKNTTKNEKQPFLNKTKIS